MISPLVDLVKKYKVDPEKMKLEMSTLPLDATIQQSFFKGGNVLGTYVYRAHDYFQNGTAAVAHACVIIRVEPKTISISQGDKMVTRELVIKNSYNAEQIIRIPQAYNTDEFDQDPAAFKAKFTDIKPNDFLVVPFGAHLNFKTIQSINHF